MGGRNGEGDRTREMKRLRENGGDTGDTKQKGDNHRRTKNQISFKKLCLFISYNLSFIKEKMRKRTDGTRRFASKRKFRVLRVVRSLHDDGSVLQYSTSAGWTLRDKSDHVFVSFGNH